MEHLHFNVESQSFIIFIGNFICQLKRNSKMMIYYKNFLWGKYLLTFSNIGY